MDASPQDRFVTLLEKYLSPAESARRAGISLNTVESWRRDKAFDQRCYEAIATARGRLIGQLVDAAYGEGDFTDLDSKDRVRVLQKLALEVNPELTGKDLTLAAKGERRFLISLVPRTERIEELPMLAETVVDAEYVERPSDEEAPLLGEERLLKVDR